MNGISYGSVNITDRKNIDLTGVKSVDSFDEYMITLTVYDGTLTVEGEQLSITALDLDKGRVSAKGMISGVYYSDAAAVKKSGFISRIIGNK